MSNGANQRTLADLARLAEEQPLVWLVPSTIIQGGIHVLFGKEESFKTTLAMQLLEALSVGGRFLDWEVPGGLRVGLAELEMTEVIFKMRAQTFLKPTRRPPEIHVLTEDQRRKILDAQAASARVAVIVQWVKELGLHVLVIDSAAKLFPPTANIGSQPVVSDLFSQLQKIGCTIIVIAHPRKRDRAQPAESHGDNDDIAGSGRFAQDPDIVLEVWRPDRRAPRVVLSWGKNRMDFKPNDLELFFDAVDFRLHARHPFLHLLPASREQLIEQAEKRFGWKRATVDEHISTLKELRDKEGNRLVVESRESRQAIFSLAPSVSASEIVENSGRLEAASLVSVSELMEKSGGDFSAKSACDTSVGATRTVVMLGNVSPQLPESVDLREFAEPV
jgi:hypothetical protein